MPKVDIGKAPIVRGADYPTPLDQEFAGRIRRRLGDAVGIKGFGVNLTTLPPGGRSSLRHWHEVEDEMVIVLSGALTLIDDDGETEIAAGEAAGFPGGTPNAHHFINRGSVDAVFLEIGTRPAKDRCHYADHDLVAHDHNGTTWFSTRDGTPISNKRVRFR